MDAISGNFNVSQLQQKITERFNSADTNNDGAVTKSEIGDMLAQNDRGTSRIDNFFNNADTNGDGSITSEERQQMVDNISDRIGNKGDKQTAPLDQLKALLESLSESVNDPEQKEELTTLLKDLDNNELNYRSFAKTFELLNDIIPSISTDA